MEHLIDQTTKVIFGIAITTTAVLGVMIHQAMNVESPYSESMAQADTTQFTCFIAEDLNSQGNVKVCCWDDQCSRFPVMPY